jgi:transposase InsO family protein
MVFLQSPSWSTTGQASSSAGSGETLAGVGLIDIKTRVAHPQSNGLLDRLHRTHRAEGLNEQDVGIPCRSDYHPALEATTEWGHNYSYERPHSALKYLCLIDCYRGQPEVRLAERAAKLCQGAEMRRAYWSGL